MANPITDEDFQDEVLNADTPVLVDFWAPWCGPCKAMLPVLDEITAEYEGKVKVVKVNVDENTEAPQQYNVMSIPNFLIFNDGEVVHNFVGAKPKEEITAALDELL